MDKLTIVVAMISAAGSACGGDNNSGGGKVDLTAEVAKVNGLVPSALKADLVFEQHDGEDGKLVGIAPTGWTAGMMPGSLKAPEGGPLGDSRMTLSYNCDGSCTAKDWAAASDKALFKAYTGKHKQLQTDEPWPDGGRFVVSTDPGGTYIVLAQWKKQSNRYYSCFAKVDKQVASAAPAFIEACKAMKPSW